MFFMTCGKLMIRVVTLCIHKYALYAPIMWNYFMQLCIHYYAYI